MFFFSDHSEYGIAQAFLFHEEAQSRVGSPVSRRNSVSSDKCNELPSYETDFEHSRIRSSRRTLAAVDSMLKKISILFTK